MAATESIYHLLVALSLAHTEMGNKLVNVATTESHPHLANALRKLGRTWHSLADLDQAQSISECVIIGDSLGYQALNARSAKETLQQRTGVLEEYQAAVKTTISKRRQIERLKASSNIQAHRVDEALEDLEEAKKYEHVLAKRAEGISQNLHRALEVHNNHANNDITAALIEHTRSTIMYEKQHLRELEALRVDVANAANHVDLPVKTAPKPTVVPPLEDDFKLPAQPPPSHVHSAPLPPTPQTAFPHPVSNSRFSHVGPSTSLYSSSGPPFPAASHAPLQSQLPTPVSPSLARPRDPLSQPPPQSTVTPNVYSHAPGVGPSANRAPVSTIAPAEVPSATGPPLGGRFMDGTRSMFVTSPSSPLGPPVRAVASQVFQSPQRPQSATPQGPPVKVIGEPYDPLSAPTTPPVNAPSSNGYPSHPSMSNSAGDLDPLGQAKPHLMTGSVRLPPTRSRLDAREAASKLANMF
jgi:hypothetical protein